MVVQCVYNVEVGVSHERVACVANVGAYARLSVCHYITYVVLGAILAVYAWRTR